MQAKHLEKEQARELRKRGLSYSEILEHIPVSQASLSLWLRHVPLTSTQQKRLFSKGRLAGGIARHQQRLDRQKELVEMVKQELPTLLKDHFFTLGLALYWAEGSKQKPWETSVSTEFSNSDPRLILLMRIWLQKYGAIALEDFQYYLHIHTTAKIERARKQWANILGVSSRDLRISLKKHVVLRRHKHENYIGLIRLRARRSVWLNRRIELWSAGAARTFLV